MQLKRNLVTSAESAQPQRVARSMAFCFAALKTRMELAIKKRLREKGVMRDNWIEREGTKEKEEEKYEDKKRERDRVTGEELPTAR